MTAMPDPVPTERLREIVQRDFIINDDTLPSNVRLKAQIRRNEMVQDLMK